MGPFDDPFDDPFDLPASPLLASPLFTSEEDGREVIGENFCQPPLLPPSRALADPPDLAPEFALMRCDSPLVLPLKPLLLDLAVSPPLGIDPLFMDPPFNDPLFNDRPFEAPPLNDRPLDAAVVPRAEKKC